MGYNPPRSSRAGFAHFASCCVKERFVPRGGLSEGHPRRAISRRQQLPQNGLRCYVRLRPLDYLLHDLQVHGVVSPRDPHRDLASQLIHIRLEGVAKIHVAILVNVAVLTGLQRVRKFPV